MQVKNCSYIILKTHANTNILKLVTVYKILGMPRRLHVEDNRSYSNTRFCKSTMSRDFQIQENI